MISVSKIVSPHLNPTPNPSLYKGMGVLWNGDRLTAARSPGEDDQIHDL
ncbi:hypothetical protein [Anabaenopsis arnoldii]|uniref:Uncharacterized protein n=1 Tax=Anabaenopsis arnoldii TaxID=2152938 RepID=A0ABT5ANT8_9CYAN|nr:hypothetical protein [Anabaenopsis arnoldii]MDB9538984.1 hypothetical protein [Anabaenopsis arnoldii]MDH6091272.1 hypothetical protein [Anabaenopsis arnoldii]